MIRVVIPYHLQTLVGSRQEIVLEVAAPPTLARLLDALEARHPVLRGTIRDAHTQRRRPMLRLFACGRDLSFAEPDALLPPAVCDGREPLLVVGAIAGG